ncbi:MAG TPA: GAF domain-containing protein [Terriglobales bacterium]|nr:GAF domain-containing protein [Terriglobales bacterium]
MKSLARSYEISREIPPQAYAEAGDLESLAHDLRLSVDATGVAIVEEDAENPEALVCVVSVGRCVPAVGARLDPNFGISGRCVRECRSQKSYDTRIDPRVDRAASEQLGIRSLAVVPILRGSRCVGLIEAVSDRAGHFDEDKLPVIEQAASSAALLLDEHQQLTSEEPTPAILPASQEAEERPIPQLIEHYAEAEPEAIGSSHDEDSRVPLSSSVSTPKFLEAQHSQSRHSWRQWAVTGAIALLAIVVGIRILPGRVPRHLFAASHKATTSLVLSGSHAGEHVQGSPSTPETASVIKNDDASSEPLKQRAEHGDVAAQINLGQSYLTGNKLPEDRAKAASWYIMAGENGNAEAKRQSIEITRGMAPFQIGEIRFDLGKMYLDGVGAHQNYISAYRWFELAKAAGNIRAESEENTLEQKMSPVQIQEARQQASQWLQSHSRRTGHHSRQ